jgi:hypothetical protein
MKNDFSELHSEDDLSFNNGDPFNQLLGGSKPILPLLKENSDELPPTHGRSVSTREHHTPGILPKTTNHRERSRQRYNLPKQPSLKIETIESYEHQTNQEEEAYLQGSPHKLMLKESEHEDSSVVMLNNISPTLVEVKEFKEKDLKEKDLKEKEFK